MRENKGFTLIELLAVIVILAIIALIATPVILSIINESRESARANSALAVKKSVQLAYQTALTTKTSVTVDDVMTQLNKDGMDNATISGNTITTKDGVVCTVSSSNENLTLECGADAGIATGDYDYNIEAADGMKISSGTNNPPAETPATGD